MEYSRNTSRSSSDMLDSHLSLLCIFLALVFFAFAATRMMAKTGQKSSAQNLALPPGAEYIWGHERAVFSQQPGRFYRTYMKNLGLTFRIKAAFGAPDLLVLSDPVGIAHVLQKRVFDYHHSQVVRPRIARLLGKGLGWVEGQSEHKRMKRLVSKSLNAETLRAMSSVVRDAASRVLEDLIDSIQANDNGGEAINILDWTGKATLSVVGRVAFLHDFEGGKNVEAQHILQSRRKGVTPMFKYTGFLVLMLLRRFPFLNDLPIFAIQSQGIAKQAIQSGVAKEMVKRSKELVDENMKEDHADLLTNLLNASQHGLVSKEELFEHISTFIMTGHEATTLTLGFTIWELSRNPHIQQRLREELQEFSTQEPTYDDFANKLPYLDAILKETLRMYPGLPYMERVATKHDVVPLGPGSKSRNGTQLNEIEILPGQTVIVPIIAIQRSELVWPESDVFLPERWLGELPPEDLLPSGWSNLLAFSDGPRSCIGARLAIFQYKVIISKFVQQLRFEGTGEDIGLKINSSIQPTVIGKEGQGPRLPVHLHIL